MSAARIVRTAVNVRTRQQLQWGVRSKSTAASTAATSASLAAGGCPRGSGRSKEHSTVAACPVHASTTEGSNGPGQPKLVEVPSLPFFGSLLTGHSGMPSMDKAYKFWPEMRRRYGDFYSFGLPGLGTPKDPKSTLFVIQDPAEMMKVIRSEGSYPSGMAQGQWAINKWQREAGFETVLWDDGGFFGQGENWKRIRGFMQTDLLHPSAAKGYVSGIIEAAELASKGAPACGLEMNDYFNRCAFDMFSTVMFGELTHVTDPGTSTDPDNTLFVEAAKTGLTKGVQVARSLKDMILVKNFGVETENYRKMKDNLNVAWQIGSDKIERFMERRARGQLSEREKNSYLYRAVERHESESGGTVSIREAKELSWVGLFAAVDTTSGKMGWNVLQAALNPDAQERLYDEVAAAVESKGVDGRLTVEALHKKNAPYLDAFVRETHRLTPVVPIGARKLVASDDLSIHGRPMPRGSAVLFDAFSAQRDPAIVDDPQSFRPERWLPDAVEARKGTSAEILDHPFFKDPFSQGPRKCPGSRVALNEVAVILAQLVLDWKISMPNVESLQDVEYSQESVLEPKLPPMEFAPRT